MSVTLIARPPGAGGSCDDCPLLDCAQFLALSPPLRTLLAGLMQGQAIAIEGAEIVAAGQPGELFTLHDGWAYRWTALADGRRQIIDFHLPGDLIGVEAALGGPVTHSVTMLTSGVLCRFGRPDLARLLADHPALGELFLRSAMAEIRSLERSVAALGRMTATERLATLLVGLYRRSSAINRVAPGSRSCFFPATQRHLADAAGLTPTHVNNTLRHLREQGIATLSGRLLTVHDLPELTRLAGHDAAPPGRRLLL